MKRSWTLRHRVVALMLLIGVVLVGLGAWTAWQTWSSEQSVLHEQQTLLPAQANTQVLFSALVDQEAGVSGYVVTGDASYLEAYKTGAERVEGVIPVLRAELRGQPEALASLARVETLYDRWQTRIAEPDIAKAGAGLREAGSARKDVDVLSSSVSILQGKVDRLAELADASIHDTLSTAFALSVDRGGIVLLMVVIALLLLGRWIKDPFEQLAGEVRMVAGGELNRPVEAQGPPELAALGRDVEGMRRQLRDEGDELRQLRQTLAERSPLHVLLHSELEPTGEASSFAIAGRLLPAEGVLAGDWYDAWQRDGEGLAAALVDISGHGPAAGLFALKIKYLLTPAMRWGLSPGEAIAWTAGECAAGDEQFATAIVVELDRSSGVCRYANAGHPSGLVFRETGVEELAGTGPLICVLPGSWRTSEVPVSEGDLLVLFTDGVTEARLPDGSEFGVEGIIEVVRALRPSESPDDVAESLLSALRDRCRLPLKDDATVVVVRVGPYRDQRESS